jgi:hypothetical protein
MLYRDAQGYLRINGEMRAMADVGSPALYFLGGNLGATIGTIAGTDGILQANHGVGQIAKGDTSNGVANALVGLLNALSFGAWKFKPSEVLGNGAKAADELIGTSGSSGGKKAADFANEVAGAGPRNPLLEDAIPRSGERLVVNQGPFPTCGHNSCGMVLDTLGKEVDVAALIKKLPPTDKGIMAHSVADLMKGEGVPASVFGGRNVKDLARYTAAGVPVVVRVVDNSGGTGFSHFVVVDGVTNRSGASVVAIRDPHGKQYFSPAATFEKNFSGDVVVPRSAFK